jgi:hypothetical protein
MLPPAAVDVLSGIAGIFVVLATGVSAFSAVIGFLFESQSPVAAPLVVLAALATVFIRFGWDLFSRLFKP